MALNWPDTETAKRLLDVSSEDFDDDIEGLVLASVDRVKLDCGLVDEDGNPDPDADPQTNGQVQAAMRALVLMRPGSNDGLEAVGKDRVYNAHLMGTRTRKGFA